MTKEKAEKILPVIQAIINGQKIQVNINNRWEDVDENHNCAFLPESYEYRIKPEPKFRPFANAEECWQEMQKHQPFGWVKSTLFKDLALVKRVTTLYVEINRDIIDYKDALDKFTFADDTNFGVKM